MRHRALSWTLAAGLVVTGPACPSSSGDRDSSTPTPTREADSPPPDTSPTATSTPVETPEESPVPSDDPAAEQVEAWQREAAQVRERSDRLEARILDGIGSSEAAEQARRDLVALRVALERRLEDLRSEAGEREAVEAYRAELIEYLEWRRATGYQRFLRYLEVAEDEEVDPSARARIVLEEAAAAAEEDAAWQERLDAAAAEVTGGD